VPRQTRQAGYPSYAGRAFGRPIRCPGSANGAKTYQPWATPKVSGAQKIAGLKARPHSCWRGAARDGNKARDEGKARDGAGLSALMLLVGPETCGVAAGWYGFAPLALPRMGHTPKGRASSPARPERQAEGPSYVGQAFRLSQKRGGSLAPPEATPRVRPCASGALARFGVRWQKAASATSGWRGWRHRFGRPDNFTPTKARTRAWSRTRCFGGPDHFTPAKAVVPAFASLRPLPSHSKTEPRAPCGDGCFCWFSQGFQRSCPALPLTVIFIRPLRGRRLPLKTSKHHLWLNH
jgi:hypothetical protein